MEKIEKVAEIKVISPDGAEGIVKALSDTEYLITNSNILNCCPTIGVYRVSVKEG